MKLKPLFASICLMAAGGGAHAADDAHGGGFLSGLATMFADATTNTAFLATALFLAIAWRLGAFRAVAGMLDARADRIRNELDESTRLREEAEAALAEAERRRQEADDLAASIIKTAKEDAARLIEETKRELTERLARREAQAEARIARAEADAARDVRRAAADAATAAAAALMAKGDGDAQLDRALSEIDKSLN